MSSLLRTIGAVRLLAYWIRMTMPVADRQILAAYLKDVRAELSPTARKQIDMAIEIIELHEVESDAWIKTLLATAREEQAGRKLAN